MRFITRPKAFQLIYRFFPLVSGECCIPIFVGMFPGYGRTIHGGLDPFWAMKNPEFGELFSFDQLVVILIMVSK